MTAEKVKADIAKAGLKQWQVAEQIGISENAFSKLMRHDIKPEIAAKIADAIKALKTPC